MRSAKLFYFLFFGGVACLIPFLSLHYQNMGLTGGEIGVLTGIVPLVGLAGSSALGMLSDFTGRHRLFFLLAIAAAWISVFLMMRAATFVALLPLVVLYGLASSPIIPLVDDAVMEWLGPERRAEYGRQRVWGSYGWGLAGAVIGVVIAAAGLRWSFLLFLAAFALLLLVGVRLPMTRVGAGARFLPQLRVLLGDRAWLLFIGAAMVVGASMGIFLNFLFPYLETLGISATVMGLTLTLATISEIPIFLYSDRLLARWSPAFLLALALLFTALRALSYAGISTSWQVLAVSLLHGPTFALMWVSGVAFSASVAPRGLGATAQSVFGGTTMGLGVAIGAIVGGFLYDAIGAVTLFYTVALAALLAALLFVWINRRMFVGALQKRTG